METCLAKQLSDASVRTAHPRLDFRTDEGRRYAMKLAPFISQLLHSGMRVLDLGCSTGKSTFMLCELGAHVTAIDVSFLTLRFASNIRQSINAAARHVAGDYARLPFCSRYFELALFPLNIVECSPMEFEHIVNETARVLIDKGIFVITVSYKWSKGDPICKPELKDGTITIPEQGTFSYPSYSWSVDEVCNAAGKMFQKLNSIPLTEQNSEMLVFQKL